MVKTPEPMVTERKRPVDDAIQANAEEAKEARGDNLTQAQRDAQSKQQDGDDKKPVGNEDLRKYALELAVRHHDASGSQVERARQYAKFLAGEEGGENGGAENPQQSRPPAKGF